MVVDVIVVGTPAFVHTHTYGQAGCTSSVSQVQ
jgi:hypothetical protein